MCGKSVTEDRREEKLGSKLKSSGPRKDYWCLLVKLETYYAPVCKKNFI